MQKNVAICVIILVTLGAVVASWLAFRYWKRRFKRELLVSYHIGKQRMSFRNLAPVKAPSTSTSSSAPHPPSTHTSPPSSTNINTPEDKEKQRDTSEWSADSPAPATEQSSPSAPAQGGWSSTSNTGTSFERGQAATQSEPNQRDWGRGGQSSSTKDTW